MFENNPNLVKYDEKVMIYKNFFDKDYVEKINNEFNTKYNGSAIEKHAIDWYAEKTTQAFPELMEAWNKISEFISPTHIIHPQLSMQIIVPGDGGMFVHADSPGEGNHHLLTAPDRWSTCCGLDYGVIGYFGDFEGGEVFYPELNNLEVKVEPGDLIIHGATGKWAHGVKEVTKGYRLAFSNFCLKKENNPGSFYNYGTEECSIRQASIQDFITPLIKNTQFPDS